jgi:copper transport protein
VPVLTMTDDAAHLAAVCAWVGGLVLLTVRLLPNPVPALAPVLRRWSTLAMWAVATIVVTGTVQAWRQLGSIHALGYTGYGRWVITKSVGLLILVALGNLGRIRVRRYAAGIPGLQRTGASLGAMRAEAQEDGLGRLRRSVLAEVLIAAGVLVASAMLVVSNPSLPRSAAAGAMGAGAMGAGAMGAGAMPGSDHASHASACSKAVLPNAVTAKICVAPAVSGTPTVTVLMTSTASGAGVDPVEVTATAALPSRGVEPIPLHLVRTGPGKWTAAAAPMGFAGEWQITVTARTSDIDAGVGMVHVVLH